jgi:biotin synthase-like enzyme
MSCRVCMCCGEPMSENDLEQFSNPNVCATCLNLTWEMDEFTSTILTTDPHHDARIESLRVAEHALINRAGLPLAVQREA